jgi:hypothetical protein
MFIGGGILMLGRSAIVLVCADSACLPLRPEVSAPFVTARSECDIDRSADFDVFGVLVAALGVDDANVMVVSVFSSVALPSSWSSSFVGMPEVESMGRSNSKYLHEEKRNAEGQ